MYAYYGYQCFLCEKSATQRAHIIGDTKLNRKVYGNHVIDHILNWLPACGLDHNKMIDIGMIPCNQKVIASIIDGKESFQTKRTMIESFVMHRCDDN